MGPKSFSTPLPAAPWQVALACFANMFCVGTVYALSTLQIELPRVLEISRSVSLAPFGVACLGLSIGVGICATLVAKQGARTTTAAGTSIWGIAVTGTGYLLAQSNLYGIIVCLFLGGVGVGLTYLAVVVMVGQSFPTQPLARSAIGPLGFSSGTAACILMYMYFGFDSLGSEALGKVLCSGGVAILTIGLITIAVLPSDARLSKDFSPALKSQDNSLQGFFSVLLFFNALPGMTVFAALLPMASNFHPEVTSDHFNILPYSMIALALGGFLAPLISSILGPKTTFVSFFGLRGLALVIFSMNPQPAIAVFCLCTVLFAHGTGFSVIPGLVKARQAKPENFIHSYGQVLISWGVSGLVGIIIASLSSSLEGMRTASFLIGLIVLTFGISLNFFNVAV